MGGSIMSTLIKAGTATSGAVVEVDATGKIELQTGSTPTTAITIDTSQNVGIGTTSPSSYDGAARNLVVGNLSGNTGITISSGSSSSGYLIFADGTTGTDLYDGYITYNHSSRGMIFYTAATDRMRITSGGMLAINTTTAVSGNTSAKLVVKGASGADVGEIQVATNGTYAFDFRNAAGTNVGNITVNSGGTAFTTTSDYRLKENIAPMVGALETVSKLNPVTYTWKADGSNGQGFIAHELQVVVPDAVTGEKDAVNKDGSIRPQGIDTSYLVATLTAAIQELNAKVEAQAVRIAELEGTK